VKIQALNGPPLVGSDSMFVPLFIQTSINMIKTLRITSIAAVVLAGILFIFPVVFGVRGDGQIEQFLNSAGVIAEFREATSNKAKESDQVSPLVKQAEAFALYLNPPPKPRPVVQAPAVTPEIRPPAPVSAKFTLVGISHYQSHPEMSMALIDEPGKGLHWVRQSSEVGHLIIEQVKDGSVVVRDGQRTFEIATQQPTEMILLGGSASGAMGGKPTSPVASNVPSAGVISAQTSASSVEPPTPPETSAPVMSAEEEAALDKLVTQLASLQKGSRSDKTGSADINEEEAAAMMEKLMGDFKATRVSAEEAKKLNGLGKELEGVHPSSGKSLRPDERDPNLPAPPAPPPPTRSGRTGTRVRRPIRPPQR
jgi:hypothetical protein